jgi:hypothetical protein
MFYIYTIMCLFSLNAMYWFTNTKGVDKVFLCSSTVFPRFLMLQSDCFSQ